MIDSGLGGELFCKILNGNIKDLECLPLLDRDFFPYGKKDLSFLKERLLFLVKEAKTNLVLIACNTLSSLIFYFGITFKKTVVDVITPTLFFLKKYNYHNPLILATTNTIKMDIYGKALNKRMAYYDATDLIYALEKGEKYDIMQVLKALDDSNDALLLACTHLVKIKDELRLKTPLRVISQDEILVMLFK